MIGLDSGSVVLVHRVPPPLVLRADPHHPPHLLHPTPRLIVRQVIFAVLAFPILLLHLFLSKNHVHDLLPHTISCFRLCGLQTVWTKIKKKWYLFLVLLLQVFQVILYSPITPNWNFQVSVCLKLEGVQLSMAFVMTPLWIVLLSFICDTTFVFVFPNSTP